MTKKDELPHQSIVGAAGQRTRLNSLPPITALADRQLAGGCLKPLQHLIIHVTCWQSNLHQASPTKHCYIYKKNVGADTYVRYPNLSYKCLANIIYA